jgi:hypothetical protein
MTNSPLGPTAKDLLIELRDQPYAWPGGYPRMGVTDDGGVICAKCARDEFDRLDEATPGDGFYLAVLTINWEDNDLTCDHCNDKVECAYGE